VPRLAGAAFGDAQAKDTGLVTASWIMGDGSKLNLLANLSSAETDRVAAGSRGRPIWGGEASDRLPAWSVFWRLEDAA
jgi:maltooligosyltrehalose trehalohydrolase